MTDPSANSPLSVDLAELCIALEAEAGELRWYLDVRTGNVILVTREYDPQEYEGLTIEEIETSPKRFAKVPASTQQSLVEDMRAFIATLGDARLKESLDLALTAPRPERRFKSVLGWLPDVQARWHEFRQAQAVSRARSWLSSLGIRPAD